MPTHGTVQTRRLLLRPVTPADAGAIWRIHSDPRTNAYNPAGPMVERALAEKQAREWATSWVTDGNGYWAIEEAHAPGAVIGFGGILALTWRGMRVYNLYYRLAPDAWGRGLASELVEAAIGRWRELGEDLPLVAYTTAENVPSQKTALKGGLTRRPDLDVVTRTHTDVVFALGLD